MNHKFQINLRGVIDLLSEHLYSGPEVYVRELLQNAVDAITARQPLSASYAGEITIEIHAPKGKPPTIVFTDNGIGLTESEVHAFLATIGQSSKKRADPLKPSDFIGQFGIGILSCFVVSEEIVVISRSAKEPGSPAIEWRAKPDGTYTLKTLERDFEPGTQVWLTAKDGAAEHFAPDRVRELAKHFGGLLPYPIRLLQGRGNEIINAQPPPWRERFRSEKDRTKALLEFGREAFNTAFFDAIPLHSEIGAVDGVAFVLPYAPSLTGKRQHRVYLKNMFLTDSAENLLPDWAFFVRAVVNAGDLRPTASREGFYEDAKLGKVRRALGSSLREYLVNLAEKRPEKLEQFVQMHQRALKALAAEDDEFFAVIIDHLPFETTLGTMSFGEYRAANPTIRYVPDVDSFRQIRRIAAAQNLAIINAGFSYDADIMARAAEHLENVTVEQVDAASLSEGLASVTDAEEEAAEPFLAAAEAALKSYGCRVELKRFGPAEVPALFTTSADGRFLRSVELSKEVADPLWSGVLDSVSRKARSASSDTRLYLNAQNPLVRRLLKQPPGPALARSVQAVYVLSLMLGHHPLSSRELALLSDCLIGLIDSSAKAEGR